MMGSDLRSRRIQPRVGRGPAVLTAMATIAGIAVATATVTLAWHATATVTRSSWTAADAVLICAAAVGALAIVRFCIDLAAALRALARGTRPPAWTGRTARAIAATLIAALAASTAAHASEPPPSAGWLPADPADAAPPWAPATAAPYPARIGDTARATPLPVRDASPQGSPARGEIHIVTRGETLWSISADALDTSDAATVAAAWPVLYDANRAVVGADPDLIVPGMRLRLPAPLDGGLT